MTRKIAMTTVRTVLNLLSHGLSYKKNPSSDRSLQRLYQQGGHCGQT